MSDKKPDEKLVRGINPFGLRMLPELKTLLEDAARKSGRSLNQEIVDRLAQSLLLGLHDLPPRLVDKMHKAPFAVRRLAEAQIQNSVLAVLKEHFPEHSTSKRSAAALNDLFYEALERIKDDAPEEERARLAAELVDHLQRTASRLGLEWTPPNPDDAPF